MQFRSPSDVGVMRWGPALMTLALGLAFSGSGFLNGDAAVYWNQAVSGDILQRTTHIGYISIAWIAANIRPDFPESMDLLSVCAGALAVWRIGRGAPSWIGVAAAALVIPTAAFAEVDPIWTALVVLAATTVTAWRSAWLAAAVCVSPTALLTVPWLCHRARSVRPVLVALVTIVALIGLSRGDWLWGPRGMLDLPAWRVGRTLTEWVASLWWVAIAVGVAWRANPRVADPRLWGAVLALTPLMLAPPDVPSAVFVGLAVLMTLTVLFESEVPPKRTRGTWWLNGCALVMLLAGVFSLGQRAGEVRVENQWLEEQAQRLSPDVRMVAPWSLGVRVSLLRTGEPYGICWRNPDRVLAAQRCVCTDQLTRAAWLVEPGVPVRLAPALTAEVLPGCPADSR